MKSLNKDVADLVQSPLGSASAPSISFVGDPNTGIYSPGADQVAISTGGTGRLFVDASGNVGIGQSSVTPVFGRTVSATLLGTGATYRVAGATTSAYFFTSDGLGCGGLFQETNHPLIFGTNSTERLRITSAGNVGIGTVSPVATFDVRGYARIESVSANVPLSITHGYNSNIINISRSAGTGKAIAITETGFGPSIELSKTTENATSNSNSIGFSCTGNFAHTGSFGLGRGIDVSVTNNTGSTGILYGANISATANTAGATAIGLNVNTASSSGTRYAALFNGGNVGIGTASPGATLDVKAAASTAPLIVQGPSSEFARIDSSGRLLVGTATNTGGSLFQVNDNRIRIATAKTPASATDTGSAGEICWDANYIYVCTATNTWKRTAIATW